MKKNKKISLKNADFEVSLKFIVKDRKGRVLILKMPQNSSMAGFYDFPGGRIRESEEDVPFSKIIKRELHEEIGDKIGLKIIEAPVAIGRHNYVSKITKKKQYIFWVFFEAKVKSGKITLSGEHEDYAWVKLTKNNYKKYFVRGPLEGMTNYLTHKLS